MASVTDVTAAIIFLETPEERRTMPVHSFAWGILDRSVGGGMPLACMRRMRRALLFPEYSKDEKRQVVTWNLNKKMDLV